MPLSQYEKTLRKHNRNEMKFQRIVKLNKRKSDLERSDRHFYIMINHEKLEREAHQQKQKEISEIKNRIMLELQKNNPFTYSQYLIIWDVVTGNYTQIEQDFCKGKINKSDITATFEYIGHFSNEIINEYWKEKIMNMEAVNK